MASAVVSTIAAPIVAPIVGEVPIIGPALAVAAGAGPSWHFNHL